MDNESLQFQYSRLVDHYDMSLQQMNASSFLALIDVLCVWADMKREIDVDLAAHVPDLKLPMPVSDSVSARQTARGTKYLYAPAFYSVHSPALQINGVLLCGHTPRPGEKRPPANKSFVQWKHVSFTEWLAAEICEFGNRGTPQTKCLGIDREVLLRRVSNSLVGAPSERLAKAEKGNRFDNCIKELNTINIESVPLSYYLLLDIAIGMIDGLKPVYG